MLYEYDLKNWMKIFIYLLAVVGFFVHMIGTYLSSMKANEIIQTYKGYINLPCVLYTLGIFVLIKNIVQNSPKDKTTYLDQVIMFLKKYNFSIYLIHHFIIKGSVLVLHLDNTSLWYRLFFPIVAILVSIGITFLLRKIPGIKRIVPE